MYCVARVAWPRPPGQRLQVSSGSGGDQGDRQLDTGPLCSARLSQCSTGTEVRQQWSIILGTSLKGNCLKIFIFFIFDIVVYCKQTEIQKKQIDTKKVNTSILDLDSFIV